MDAAYKARDKLAGWNPANNDASPFWVVKVGDFGWVRDATYDQGIYAHISLLQRTANGLQDVGGKGYIPRSCIKLGKPRQNGLNMSGAFPNLKQLVPPNHMNQSSDKFSFFMSGLFQNMKNEKNTLVTFRFSVSDID